MKNATETDNGIECSVFMLQNKQVPEGTKLEQRREESKIAEWELISHTPKSILLKKEHLSDTIEFSDSFYIEQSDEEVISKEMTLTPVYVFSGKNWKLASPKKWVKMNLNVEGCEKVGDIKIEGKDCTVFKLTDCFAAKPNKTDSEGGAATESDLSGENV